MSFLRAWKGNDEKDSSKKIRYVWDWMGKDGSQLIKRSNEVQCICASLKCNMIIWGKDNIVVEWKLDRFRVCLSDVRECIRSVMMSPIKK